MAFNVADIQPSLLSPKELGDALRARARDRRISQGLSQADLAAAAGVSRFTVNRFEKGHDIGLLAFLRLAYALSAEREFASLFPLNEPQTLREMIAPRRAQRVPPKR